jgi:hypothetical protein
MLTGHIAVAMGAHGLRRSLPLWALILAAQLPDWTDAALCSAGIRSQTPGMYSHSVAATVLLALAAATIAMLVTRDARGATVIAIVVGLHTVGDYVTGLKPTWPGGPIIGLDLYGRPALDFAFEALILFFGWVAWQLSFPGERRYSRRLVFVLLALLAIQAASDIVLALSPGMKKC